MKLSSLLEKVSAVYCGDPDVEITTVVSDSRKLCAGCAFVCIKGAKHDGHDFIEEAIRIGASAVITERPVDAHPERITVAQVRETREALAYMWDTYYGHPSDGLCCIGITGTNGKTTTSYALKSILEEDGRNLGVIGNLVTMVGGLA